MYLKNLYQFVEFLLIKKWRNTLKHLIFMSLCGLPDEQYPYYAKISALCYVN